MVAVRRNEADLKPLADELGPSRCMPLGVDARKEDQVQALFDRIETLGELEVVVHNIGGNVRHDVVDTTTRVYAKVWELIGLSAFLVGREAAKRMGARQRGTIIFTGATASTRGAAGFSAFAGGMHAKRAMAQSLAREMGPKGVHVCHVVVDGPIETKFIRGLMGDAAFEEAKTADAVLRPDDIAANYLHLARQPRSAWTFEMDLRPWSEKF